MRRTEKFVELAWGDGFLIKALSSHSAKTLSRNTHLDLLLSPLLTLPAALKHQTGADGCLAKQHYTDKEAEECDERLAYRKCLQDIACPRGQRRALWPILLHFMHHILTDRE